MAGREYLRVGSLCMMKGPLKLWKDPNQVLRIAKRKKKAAWSHWFVYFVVGVGDPVGHGIWAEEEKLRPLTALEMLAMAAEE